MEAKIKTKQKLMALIAVIVCTVVFAIQDIWVASLVSKVDPLLLTFWIFLFVVSLALSIAIIKKESFKIPREAISEIIGLNLTTSVSWIFTFLALSEGSPAVVGAGTLSAPLLIIMLFLNKGHFRRLESLALFSIVSLGLVVGSMESITLQSINMKSIFYCVLASFGVVGNSFFMKRLNRFKIQGNVVLSIRFLLLLVSLGLYLLLKQDGFTSPHLTYVSVLAIGLITSYFPLLALYFAHLHLSIFIINLLLAITPVCSILILGMYYGFHTLNSYHIISVAMILSGVFYGYFMEARREQQQAINN